MSCPLPSGTAWASSSGAPWRRGCSPAACAGGSSAGCTAPASTSHLRDERRIDAVEQLIPVAAEAGLPLTHLAMAFAIAHPGVTAALLGPRTMEQLDDLLSGAEVVLSDDLLDRIDAIVPPGTDIGQLQMAYVPPALQRPDLRRRPVNERSAA
jgi:Aldo/keto reductase family